MKHETLARAITGLDDALIDEAAEKRRPLHRFAAMAACLLLVLGIALYGLRPPTVLLDGTKVTAQPRAIGGETAVMTMRLYEPVQVELTLKLPRETKIGVSAGTLVTQDGESTQTITARGTVEVLWVIEDAAEDETYQMTIDSATLLLAHDASRGGWTICKQ